MTSPTAWRHAGGAAIKDIAIWVRSLAVSKQVCSYRCLTEIAARTPKSAAQMGSKMNLHRLDLGSPQTSSFPSHSSLSREIIAKGTPRLMSDVQSLRPLGAIFLGSAMLMTLTTPCLAQVTTQSPKTVAVKPLFCPTNPYRWQEDCRDLAKADLQGITRLRYLPLTDDGKLWLTIGGEARTRLEMLHDINFGIGGQPGYTTTAGRLLLNADLRSEDGVRTFVQLGTVNETGRKPGPRPQDRSAIDITQAFVDLPIDMGTTTVTTRIGRQELDLSKNRLVTARDGVTLRRAFEGIHVDFSLGDFKVALAKVRPMDLRDQAFDDRADKTEHFTALSVDVPSRLVGGGALNLFLLDRDRDDARYLRAQGRERRYSMGAHYTGEIGNWTVDTQGTWQTGRVSGKPVRAYGAALALDHELEAKTHTSIGFDLVTASGDKVGTTAIETFDPTYPNNFGLSDAPLFYQTNYIFGGGSLSRRLSGATWTLGTNLLTRQSTTDAIYANQKPISGAFGSHRITSLLSQISVRKPFKTYYEFYASVVQAQALGSLNAAGGRDAYYSRLQLTARF